jgi:hypothetical protein
VLNLCRLIPQKDPNRAQTTKQLRSAQFFTVNSVKQHWSVTCDGTEIKGESTTGKVVLTPDNDTLSIYLVRGYMEDVNSHFELMGELYKHCNIDATHKILLLSILAEKDQSRINELLEVEGIASLRPDEGEDEDDERYRCRPPHPSGAWEDDDWDHIFGENYPYAGTISSGYPSTRGYYSCSPLSNFAERYSLGGIRTIVLVGDIFPAVGGNSRASGLRPCPVITCVREDEGYMSSFDDLANQSSRRHKATNSELSNVRVFAIQTRNMGAPRRPSFEVDERTKYIGEKEVSSLVLFTPLSILRDAACIFSCYT